MSSSSDLAFIKEALGENQRTLLALIESINDLKLENKQRQTDTDKIAIEFSNELSNLTNELNQRTEANDKQISSLKVDVKNLQKNSLNKKSAYIAITFAVIAVLLGYKWQEDSTQKFINNVVSRIELSKLERQELKRLRNLPDHPVREFLKDIQTIKKSIK